MSKVRRPEMLNKRKESAAGYVVLGVAVFLLAVFLLLEWWIGAHYFVVEVSGDSMQNTVFDGDLVYAERNFTAERGDIIIIDVKKYREEDNISGDYIIKRLIAKEGDSVYCDGKGRVFVKRAGEDAFLPLSEAYAKGVTYAFSEVTVGEGQIFFLGDNRENSKDSRIVGCYDYADIAGVVPAWAVNCKAVTTGWENFRSLFGGLFG